MSTLTPAPVIRVGDTRITPRIRDGCLESLGTVTVRGTPLRSPATRFLPWFDTYDGDVFRRFRFLKLQKRGTTTVLKCQAVSDPDVLFRERRDCSGDLCFRAASWDARPLTADFAVCFEPATATVDGTAFTGFRYWFEYKSKDVAIHRLVDRQTWEVGGNLDDVTICLRNWLTPPRVHLGKKTAYSTVGLDKWAGLLPGNLWGRWTLLPAFDMQYGQDGVLLGWFDRVSLIRTVIESNAGEDSLRCLDMHLFEQAKSVATNPKTILWSPTQLDATDALNLWTRVSDQESAKAQAQFGIRKEVPPAVIFSENVWTNVRFASTYEKVVATAAEFGGEYVFIDPCWEHQQALKETLEQFVPAEKQKGTILEKLWHQNQCVTLDFEVAEVLGGEKGLKALCRRAGAKGIKIMSWMAAHYSPNTTVQFDKSLAHGNTGIYAARESGRHPDTGYAASCWTANLNGPVAERIRKQVLGVCKRTGMAGFLWDSFCNLGWWQVDYSDGSMRPQFDKMAAMYAALTNAGLYIMPEAIVTFSGHSCCGLHGGNIYADDQLGFAYNTNIGLWFGGEGSDHGPTTEECRVLKGDAPFETLFQSFAHKRIATLHFHTLPREQWRADRVQALKDLIAAYKKVRPRMQKRTVLKNGAGVRWDTDAGDSVLFSFKAQKLAGTFTDVLTGQRVSGQLQANRVYSCKVL